MSSAARISPAQTGGSIRTRLTLTLLPLVLLGVVLTGGASYLRARAILRQQVEAQLVSAVEAEAGVLAEWIQEREQRLTLASQRPSLRTSLATLVAGGGSALEESAARGAARSELESMRSSQGTTYFNDLVVVRASDGRILASTETTWENSVLTSLLEGSLPSGVPGTRALFDEPVLSPGKLIFVSSVPVRAASPDAADSLLLGVNGGLQLATVMDALQVFWEERGAYVVQRGETHLLVLPDLIVTLPQYATEPLAEVGEEAHPAFANSGSSTAATLAWQDAESSTAVIGAFQWLDPTGIAVVVELPQSEVFSSLNSLALFVLAVLLVVGALTAFIVAWAARQILQPLGQLTLFAERLSQGDLTHRVESHRSDEIGRLASTLNFMADELGAFYGSLEQRVEERTRQIRTAADVAKEAAAIRNVDELLAVTVNVISARFGFYHAGVFMVDPAGEYAVLRAASSPGGKRLLARGHKLPVGKVGLVGYVTGTGKPRIALDVGEDAVHFANPDLPETRSELALPLRVGEQLIGALDVQSVEPNAFGEEDVLVLQTMADQLAVAIENARLLQQESRLSDLRRKVLDLYQTMTQQVSYDQLLAILAQEVRRAFDFRAVRLGLVEGDQVVVRSAAAADQASLPRLGTSDPLNRGLMGRAIAQKRTVSEDTEAVSDGQPGSALAVPLISRGRVLGALAVDSELPREALLVEAENLELLAGQAAVSLENARLFEETQRNLTQLDSLYRQRTATAWSERLASLRGRDDLREVEFGRPRDPAGGAPPKGALEAAIRLQGEVIGRLNLEPSHAGDWSVDEKEILEAVADEVAGALEQVRLMDEVQRRVAQLQAAAEIARESTSVLNLDTLLTRTVSLIRERIGFRAVSIVLVEGDGGLTVVSADESRAAPVARAAAAELDDLTSLLLSRVHQSGKPELIADVASTPGGPSLGSGSVLGVPLRIGQRVIGMLRVQHDLAHAFAAEDVAVFEIIADQLAVAVQNARLFEETLRRAEREQSVIEITGRIRGSSDPESMLQTALREVREALGARRARIVRHGADVPALEASPNAASADGGDGDSPARGSP
jgi:GAF domain-containing protein